MHPSLAEVKEIAASGPYCRVPVRRELYADAFTTIEVCRRLRAVSHHVFLLESAESDQHLGRYSFIGFDPSREITCLDGELRVRTNVEGGEPTLEVRQVEHPGTYLRQVLAEHRAPQLSGFPPF